MAVLFYLSSPFIPVDCSHVWYFLLLPGVFTAFDPFLTFRYFPLTTER